MEYPFGFVLGNGNARACTIVNGEVRSASLISASGKGSILSYSQDMEAAGQTIVKPYDALKAGEYVIHYDNDEEFFTGEFALRHTKDGSTGRGDKNRYKSPRVLHLLHTLAGILIPDQRASLYIVSCIPANIYKEQEIRDGMAKIVNGSNNGLYNFSLNGKSFSINTKIRKILAEGVPPTFLHGIKEDETYAIIDIGEHTTDLYVTTGITSPIPKFCGGFDIGVSDVGEYVSTAFEKKYGRALELYERSEIIHNHVNKKPHKNYAAHTKLDKTDLDMWMKKGIKEVGGKINERIAIQWKKGKGLLGDNYDEVWKVGGGALLFGETLEEIIYKDKMFQSSDPALDTPLGCLRFAQKLQNGSEKRANV